MSRLIRSLASPGFAISLMGAAGFWAAAGAFWPGGSGEHLFRTWPFMLIAAALAAGLLVSLVLRLPRTNSIRATGSAALHMSLVLVTIGAVLSGRGARQARLEIIEGQVRPLPGADYSIRLDRLHPFYRSGSFVKGHAAEVTVFSGFRPLKRQIIHANRPLKFAGYRVRLALHGFAPLMDVNGNGTGEKYRGFVSLQTKLGPEIHYWRHISFPGVGLEASAVLRPSADGPFPREPEIKFVARIPQTGRLCAATVGPGQSFEAGPYEVAFGEIRYWAALEVRRDPGLPLIFAAFWMAILGATAALLPRLARG